MGVGDSEVGILEMIILGRERGFAVALRPTFSSMALAIPEMSSPASKSKTTSPFEAVCTLWTPATTFSFWRKEQTRFSVWLGLEFLSPATKTLEVWLGRLLVTSAKVGALVLGAGLLFLASLTD